MIYTWSRYGGYECSSVGDKRFSAFSAYLPDGRSIEEHYQCDVKEYDPGGRNWKRGKGRPPLDKSKDLWGEYKALWVQWAAAHPDLIAELRARAVSGVLSDHFATTPINQARALAEILNGDTIPLQEMPCPQELPKTP